MKKRLENINPLSKRWLKTLIAGVRQPLFSMKSIEASSHCAVVEAESSCPQFVLNQFSLVKVSFILIMLLISMNSNSQDTYITTEDLNLRSGAGENYSSIIVLAKGDTVNLFDDSGDYWAKIQYQDKIGYSSKKYLQKIEITDEVENESENSNEFSVFVIWLLVVIVSVNILMKSGDKYRKKSTAIALSFFFGALGFQKYYLGEKRKGLYSILFCWTFIPALVGIIDSIKFAFMKGEKFNDLYNWNKIQNGKAEKTTYAEKSERKSTIKVNSQRVPYLNQSKQKHMDETIIDVSTQNLDLSVEQKARDYTSQKLPPYWGQSYVYSFSELRQATKEQKQFYIYLKNRVVNGEYVDIQGNSNYAFILYFDLINEYENHRNIELLDRQFTVLGGICSKTKSYSLNYLQAELRKRNDSFSIDKLKYLEGINYQIDRSYSSFNPDLYKLGNEYKDKLGLNEQEVIWLNKFDNPTNVFLSIEGCCTATLKQFVTLLKELEKQLIKQDVTLAKEVFFFKEKLKNTYVEKYSDWEGYDASYLGSRAESDIYITIFKRVENSVRESFGHKRKVSGDFPSLDESLSEEFETRLGGSINALIEQLKQSIVHPNLETQIELNTQNVNRWKIEFDELIEGCKQENISVFIDGVIKLEEVNQKNPNIENIFYQASKYISKQDKTQSLKYYAKYIFYDLKSKKFDNKELTKTVRKSLFKTEEQIIAFKEIIRNLIATNDIHTALDRISKIYIPKRKRIHLDRSEIKEVEEKHIGTVELLNGYLVEEEIADTEINEKTEEDIEITIVTPKENNSIFISGVNLDQIQVDLVEMIISNSFELHQDEVDKYALLNGMFKNQLIDSINEACSEKLDGEVLIEEDDENYIVEESYYKEIAK